jgi:hypothetical protein
MRSIGTRVKRIRKQVNIENAKRDGLRIVEPKRNEIQIDLDGAKAIHVYARQYMFLEREGVTKGWRERMTVSKSGGSHMHVTITTPHNMDDVTRCAYAAVLGDDMKRAAFNLARVIKGTKYPIVFFERGRK